MRREGGYTLVELIMAMSVFSFMLIIIVSGFVIIIRMHDQSVATGIVQDNAQNVVAQIERSVRDSATTNLIKTVSGKPTVITDDTPATMLCLNGNTIIRRSGAAIQTLPVANCDVATPTGSAVSLTTSDTRAFALSFNNITYVDTRPTIRFSLTIGSTKGTYTSPPYGPATSCIGSAADRAFCAITTVQGGAASRGLDGGV